MIIWNIFLMIVLFVFLMSIFIIQKGKRNKALIDKNQNEVLKLGYLCGIAGTYSKKEFSIHSGDEIRIGRDKRNNDLIIQNDDISNKHCILFYDGKENQYYVKDLSEKGTYLSSGQRIKYNQFTRIIPGSVIYLGNRNQSFQVGEKE
ncbi:FHA domain-containing protein [Eubacterium sp. An3]|uniref:FHA domain-containing protein n=1 Tax=Eubacterium sp. An3 TaxID=1965628 RepID=UPI000B376882|nr:FHA domain-containing protein [Eubacterium sp. An3]OUO29628.1 hypothetical protein B5F87_03750 [Eubacterium sp. An3]